MEFDYLFDVCQERGFTCEFDREASTPTIHVRHESGITGVATGRTFADAAWLAAEKLSELP